MDSLYFYQRSSAVGINKNKNLLNVEKLIGGHHYFLFLFIPSFKIRDYHCAGQIYMSNFTLLCCCMHWKYLWKPKILWFFSHISKHQLNFLRPFWDIIPLWNGYSAATYTYLPSITVVAVGETDNTCTCCYTSGIFFPKILPFDIVPDDSNSAFGSNNDQLWLDESSEFSLDWNSVVLHWITRVFGFVMITFFTY